MSNNEHKYADSINLLSVSPEKKQTIELSIPSYLNIKTQDGENENIASFYSKGGTALEINTIQDFLDCPIDYYIEIDMAGVEQVVDIIGGIEINNHIEFTYQGTHFPIGKQQLNGEDTMKYIKMLAQDPHKEIGRAKREREVITGILDKGLSFKTLAKYKDILEVVSKHMKTNLSFNELYDIQVNYKIAANNVKQIQVQTKNEEVDGKVIQVPEQNEIAKLSEMLKNN
ncbi:LCP family glycopolymer transferase [Enterococcus rivorum]|uniref:LCP family glycopolymer transferase n=1 Tax=Enterococcus rivorum TaxID=762845 RepID=UPI00364339ED